MTKEFNRTFIASMKRVARNIASSVKEKNKLEREIAERQARITEINKDIEESEATIRRKTGYGVMDLVKREVVDTGKVDKNGRPIKDTQYNLIYPETVIPVQETIETEVMDGDKEVSPEEELPFMTEDVMNPSNEI